MRDPIEQLLTETDLADDEFLRDFLIELQHTGTSVRPMPSSELVALMTPSQRRSRRRRAAVITAIIVVGTVGAGVTAAAASPEVRAATSQVFQSVVGTLFPGLRGGQVPPQPVSPDVTSSPAPTSTAAGGENVTTHPSPTSHPNSTNHPGASDHPGSGQSNAATNNADIHSTPAPPHPSAVPSSHPVAPRGGATPTR